MISVKPVNEMITPILNNIASGILRVIQYIFFSFSEIFMQEYYEDAFNILALVLGIPNDLIKIKNKKAYSMIGAYGCEGFIDCVRMKHIEINDLESLLDKITRSRYLPFLLKYDIWSRMKGWIDSMFHTNESKRGASEHYEEFGEYIIKMSGPRGLHSALDFSDTENIAEAEEAMLKKCGDRLQLKQGMTVLDIGCGYGGYAQYLAENYGVHVTGITISQSMAQKAKARCESFNVDIKCMDYENITGKYDRIISIEMFEHVPINRRKEFFRLVADHLEDSGLFLFQVNAIDFHLSYNYQPIWKKTGNFSVNCPNICDVIILASEYFDIENLENCTKGQALNLETLFRNYKLIQSDKNSEEAYFQYLFYLTAGKYVSRNSVLYDYQIKFTKNRFYKINQ